MSNKTELIPFVHVLRGMAPIIVVWCHLGGWWFMNAGVSYELWNVYQGTIGDGFRLKHSGAHLAVAVFFLISGYIISHVANHESQLEFIVKRAFRLLPTLFIASGLVWLGTALTSHFGWLPILGDEAKGPRDYLMTALLLNFPVDRAPLALATTWSLWAEVIFYAIVVAIIPIIRKRPLVATWILTSVEPILVLPFHWNADLSYLGYFSIYLPLFVIGRAFYLDHQREIGGRATLAIVAANIFILALLYEFRFPGELLQGPTEVAITYLAAIILFYAAMNAGIRSVHPVVSFFANISYALYLVHLPIGSLVMSATFAAGLGTYPILFVGVLSSVGVAFLVTRFVERPAQRTGRSLLKHRSLRTMPTEKAGALAMVDEPTSKPLP